MVNIKDILKRYYYQVMIESKIKEVNFFEMKKIAEEYNKVITPTLVDTNDLTGDISETILIGERNDSGEPIIYSSSNNGLEIYYKNIHVSVVDNDKQHIIRVSLKMHNTPWEFKRNNKSFNATTPLTETMSVYLYYNVNVMDDRFCENYNYLNGTWNEYVYKTVMEIKDIIYGFTQYSQFSKNYVKK